MSATIKQNTLLLFFDSYKRERKERIYTRPQKKFERGALPPWTPARGEPPSGDPRRGEPPPPPVRAKTLNQAPQLIKLNHATSAVSVQVSRCLMEQCRIICWMCTEAEREGRE